MYRFLFGHPTEVITFIAYLDTWFFFLHFCLSVFVFSDSLVVKDDHEDDDDDNAEAPQTLNSQVCAWINWWNRWSQNMYKQYRAPIW